MSKKNALRKMKRSVWKKHNAAKRQMTTSQLRQIIFKERDNQCSEHIDTGNSGEGL